MDKISHAQLQVILPLAQQRVGSFIDPLNSAMQEADIVSAVRQAAFLAQVAHESAELLYTREIATGEQYEGRADLGNTQPGDGARFKRPGGFRDLRHLRAAGSGAADCYPSCTKSFPGCAFAVD